MTRMFLKFSIFIFVLTLSVAGCKNDKNSSNATEEKEQLPEDIVELRDDQIKIAGIEFGSISLQNLGGILKVNGVVSVSPQNLATVCMPMGGFIKNTKLLPGNYVRKGEILATLENQDFIDIQQNYLEARNRLKYAKAEYERHTDLYKDDVYSEKNVQQVEVEYKNLIAETKSLEQKLIMTGIDPAVLNEENISSTVSLKSPINGYLKSVNVNIGKYVSPTDVLFEIVNSDNLFLELTLFEKDSEKVIKGNKVRFLINNGSDEHEAVITQTSKSVTDDKTIKVFAAVTCGCKNLLPGMYVSAFIEEQGREVKALPSEAIVSFDDKDYIFIFEKNKEEDGKPFTEYRMIEVKKGISSSGFTEVIIPGKSDNNNAKIVVKGAYNLLSAKKNAGEMAC